MLIRPAEERDMSAVLELLEGCDLPTDDIGERPIDFLLAVDGGQLAGVAGLEPLGDVALLRSVAVAANARGLEVARRLCADLLEDADALECHAVYLLTLDASDYFAQFGFAEVAREQVPEAVRETAEFSQLCPAQATVMCRSRS